MLNRLFAALRVAQLGMIALVLSIVLAVGVSSARAATVSISANPVSVSSGSASTLTWTTTDATSCAASGGWSGFKAASGSQTLANLTSSATYTLRCSGADGSQSAATTVTVSSPSAGQVFLEWQRSRTNSNGSTLRDLRNHRIHYGVAPGVYGSVIDLYADTPNPGMLEHTVSGLNVGTRYYFAVAAVDAQGQQGALSGEVSAIASTPAVPTQPVWSAVISALPYTITQSGAYRLSSSLVQASGAAITIAANNVVLYGGNGFYGDPANGPMLTYAQSGAGNAILFSTAASNADIYGFRFVRGAADHTQLSGAAAIQRAGALGLGVRIHDNTFELDRSYSLGVNADDFSDARIYRNSVALRNGATNLAFVRGESSSTFKVYENTITQSATTGYTGAFHFTSRGEFYRNNITIGADVDQGFVAQGWGNTDNYFHDNNIVTAANHCRPFNPDGGSSEWLILHNTIAMTYAGNSGQTSRGISMRFGSHHHMIGFNSIDASSANTSRAIRFGGSDASWTGDDPHDIWVYHNTFRARDVALEFYGLGRGYYSWNNIYDGTSSWAVLMADDFAGNTAVSFNNDSMRAQGLPVSKGAAYNVIWSVCDSFTAGNVSGNTLGMTFSSGNCPHPVADVPVAPSGLLAR